MRLFGVFFKHCDFTYYACTCCHCWQISFHRSHIDKAFLQYEYWCVLERPAWWQNLCYKFCIGKVLRDPLYEIWSCGSSFGSWGQVFHKKCKVTFHVPFEYAENKYIFEIYKCNFVIYKCNFEICKCNFETSKCSFQCNCNNNIKAQWAFLGSNSLVLHQANS